MPKKLQFEGKTPEDAVETAVAETGIPVSELKFEILAHGGSGIFGLGLKKAKIEVTMPEEKSEAEKKPAKPRKKTEKKAKQERPEKDRTESVTEDDKPEDKGPEGEENVEAEDSQPREMKTEDEPDKVGEEPAAEKVVEADEEPKEQWPTADRVNLDKLFRNSKGVKEKTNDGGWAQPSRQTSIPKRKIKVRSYAELRGDMAMPDKVDIDLTDGEMERREKRKRERPRRDQQENDRRRSNGRDRDRGERNREDLDRGDRQPRFEEERNHDRDEGRRDREQTDSKVQVKVEIGETPITQEPPEGAEKEHLEIGREIVNEFLEKSFPEFELEMGWREDKLYYNILGDGSGLLIGRKGQTLDALQFLVNKMIDRKVGKHVRVMVDTEGYRGRREVSLQKQAEELGNRALRSGRPTVTMPLNPHDRRIIHLALKESEVLRTRSRGNGTYKKVIISPK